jgi:putative tricarboxylic transport membrane protein
MEFHERRLKRPGEDLFGWIFLVLSVGLFWQAWLIAGFSGLSSPGAFPMAAAAVMVVSACIVVLANRHHGHDTSGTPVLPRVIVIFTGLMLGYALLLSPLGFLPASFLFLLLGMKLLYNRGWPAAVGLSLAALVVVYVIFRLVFQVVLPEGVVPERDILSAIGNMFGSGEAQ